MIPTGISVINALLPCVHTTSFLVVLCKVRSWHGTLDGIPVEKTDQLAPSLVLIITPTSVARYNVDVFAGSITISLTGAFGRFDETGVHISPKFVVLNTCAPVESTLKPERITKHIFAKSGFTATFVPPL